MRIPHFRTIIIFCSILLIIIISAFMFYTRSKDISLSPPNSDSIPTGILVPTNQVQQGQLDVVSLSPPDGSKQVSGDQVLKITFSKPFQKNEIEFAVGPDNIVTQSIENNTLIIKPVNAWTEGTVYTYSVNFPQDLEKIRVYHFTTVGTPSESLPDTRDEAVLEKADEIQRQEAPDVYISNQTPFQNEVFAISYDFEPTVPAHFYFTVTPKTVDRSKLDQSLNSWLQLHGLTQEQIQSLDIRYD